MGKQHELLAIVGDLESVFRNILKESTTVFSKKPSLFLGSLRSLTLFDEQENDQMKSSGANITENKGITTTVPDRLAYTADSTVPFIDAIFQRDVTNMNAKADIVIGEHTVAKDIPATFLLSLESKLREWRNMCNTIPTLESGIEWEPDKQRGDNIYKAKNLPKTFKTKKTFEPYVLYEATKEHKAQVEKVAKDVNVGVFTDEKWSGMISSAQKSSLISRIDMLLTAVKQARRRANMEEASTAKVGQKLFDFIFKGK